MVSSEKMMSLSIFQVTCGELEPIKILKSHSHKNYGTLEINKNEISHVGNYQSLNTNNTEKGSEFFFLFSVGFGGGGGEGGAWVDAVIGD